MCSPRYLYHTKSPSSLGSILVLMPSPLVMQARSHSTRRFMSENTRPVFGLISRSSAASTDGRGMMRASPPAPRCALYDQGVGGNECNLDVTSTDRAKLRCTIESSFGSIGSAAMYLRFVTTRIDEDSHKARGVFVAA